MSKQEYGNRYKVTERIGIGGMAEVFKAVDTTLGRTVAVKVMLPQYAADATFAARFRQEAQAAANLASPYIVNIYDWGKDDDSYYIIMEYVRGIDLKSALGERGKIHPRKVAEIGSQVCSALSVAHSYGIIHRDIKSANIMVQTDGNVKVMDFGIAQAGNSGMTQDSSVLGTAHYVSPEQAQGKPLTGASDLYSLGVVMYEAATGRLPFDGPDAVSVAMKQVTEAPVPPRQINAGIDPTLEAIILKAMSKDVNRRFASANEMKQALDDYLAGRGASSVPVIGAATGNPDETVAMDKVPSNTERATTRDSYNNDLRKKNTSNNNGGGKKKVIIALVAVIIIAIIAGVALGVHSCSQAEQISVPDVTGMTLKKATAALKDADLEVGTIKYKASDKVDKGLVISQSPDKDQNAASGDSVNLVISSGEDGTNVTVPSLVGLTADEAETALEKVGLSGSVTKDYSDDVEKGDVISQSPSAKSQVPKGSTVSYVVSLGEEETNVDVPNVVGQSESSACSTLEGKGFTVEVSYDYSDDYAQGKVCSQSIASGTSVKDGSTISIVVSKGSNTGTVPSVVGMTESKAKAAIKNAGFSVSVSYAEGTEGQVISQDTSGTATKGSTIKIVVGTGTSTGASDYSDGE